MTNPAHIVTQVKTFAHYLYDSIALSNQFFLEERTSYQKLPDPYMNLDYHTITNGSRRKISVMANIVSSGQRLVVGRIPPTDWRNTSILIPIARTPNQSPCITK
jgi:hypothetical protein